MHPRIIIIPPQLRVPQYPCSAEVYDPQLGTYHAMVRTKIELLAYHPSLTLGGLRLMIPVDQRSPNLAQIGLSIQEQPEILNLEAHQYRALRYKVVSALIMLTIWLLRVSHHTKASNVLLCVGALPQAVLYLYWRYWATRNNYDVLNPSRKQLFFCQIEFIPERRVYQRYYRSLKVGNS